MKTISLLKSLAILMTLLSSATLKSQIVDIESTSDGVLIPRMTMAQRDAIAPVDEGTLIYQTNGTKGFYYYNGASWTQLGGGGGAGVISLLSANAGITNASDLRFGLMGKTNQPSEANASYPMTRSGTLRNLYVHPNSTVGAGAVIQVFVRKNGVDTSLGFSFNGGDGSTKSNLVNTVPVNAGDLISVRFQEINAVAPGAVQFFATFELH